MSCPTLEGARRLAQVTAERCHPCELIVLDAYHRVLEYAVLGEPMSERRFVPESRLDDPYLL
jgi:hypothetical protein